MYIREMGSFAKFFAEPGDILFAKLFNQGVQNDSTQAEFDGSSRGDGFGPGLWCGFGERVHDSDARRAAH
jgi:hypothetical protein